MPYNEKYRPARKAYVSEFDRFMDDYLARHPDVQEQRRRGWRIWWDHRLDPDECDLQRNDALPVPPYVYA
jgi:hypothetical protein